MEYGDVFMSGANQVDLDKLQRLQNRGLRICLQSETRTTVYDLHKHSKLQKLEHRRVAHLRNLIFKKTLKASKLQAVPRRSTRANDGPLLVVAQPKNELFKKSVHYKGGILWNELDGEIRNIKDLNTFKRKTKNWLVMHGEFNTSANKLSLYVLGCRRWLIYILVYNVVFCFFSIFSVCLMFIVH